MASKFSWFGIDFGTTNSAAFSLTGTGLDLIVPIHYGDDEGRPFPSVVAIDKKTGEIIVGRDAKNRHNELLETHHYISSIKSIIDSDEKWVVADKVWTPEDITSQIFISLKERVENNNDNELNEAVIAVPVGFSAEKKSHLRNAARNAGINVKMFISEPTAAFCSNYSELRSCKNIAVFDWGGGTLDVVILSVNDGEIREIAANGMSFAGNDIDENLAERMHAVFMRNHKQAIPFSDLEPSTRDLLIVKCEEAKCAFEDEDVVRISLNKYDSFGAVSEYMDYDTFAEIIEPAVNNAVECLMKTISQADFNTKNIDKVLCVGGSSRLRPLQEKLNEIFGKEKILYPERVMWDIAKGASIISTRESGYKLSKSIGLQLSDGSYFPLVNAEQELPCEEFCMTLGVTDQGEDGLKEARFIFTDSDKDANRELYTPVVIPIRGFEDERLKLSCYIDQDNVFKAKIGSTRIHDSRDRVWCYENLKISFYLED